MCTCCEKLVSITWCNVLHQKKHLQLHTKWTFLSSAAVIFPLLPFLPHSVCQKERFVWTMGDFMSKRFCFYLHLSVLLFWEFYSDLDLWFQRITIFICLTFYATLKCYRKFKFLIFNLGTLKSYNKYQYTVLVCYFLRQLNQ